MQTKEAILLKETDRNVSIYAMTHALLDAEAMGGAELAKRLGVEPPGEWPPPYNGRETREHMRKLIVTDPEYAGWYVVADRRLAGICGYKGHPDPEGIVEIGYSVSTPHQRRGTGSAAVKLLVRRAFRDDRVKVVVAETLPSLVASQSVLIRNGFTLVSRRHEDGTGEILRFQLTR